MESEETKPERVRFRRDEIVRLDSLPSSEGSGPALRAPRGRGFLRVAAWGLVALLALFVVLPVAIYGLSAAGVGSERLRIEAEAALSRLAGRDIDAFIGLPRLSIGPSRLLAVEVNDVRIVDAAEPGNLIEAGTLRFGLRVGPLLGGTVALGTATIVDARIHLASLPAGPGNWTAAISGPDGLVEPGLIMSGVFDGLRRGFASLDRAQTSVVELSNVEVILPPGSPVRSFYLASGVARRGEGGGLEFEVDAGFDGRAVRLVGEASRTDDGGIARFTARATVPPAYSDGPFSDRPAEGRDFALTRLGGGIDVAFEGSDVDGEPRLGVVATLGGAEVGFANGDRISGSGSIVATLVPNQRKIEIERANLDVGRSTYRFHGAVGPAPPEAGKAAHYRFELVSDGSTVAVGQSTEPALPILARLAGRYEPEQATLFVDGIGVRTNAGEVSGSAAVKFEPRMAPGLELSLSIPELPIGHVKQLWPWFAARSAQAWANRNVFGGTARNGRLSVSAAPGRIGSGVSFGAAEISGHFEVQSTRFDIAGNLPPVRDGSGIIDFRGTDVDIALTSGTLYMSTGRTVAASDGTLKIRSAHVAPVLGDLDIAVAGSADSLAELSSYKPIDAMRRLPVAVEDLRGAVTGRVRAQIPLQRNVDMSKLGWSVALDFEDLSIAKPFQGQMVTAANGSIDLNPTVAVIKAKARLSGMAAELDIAEPLAGAAELRKRDIVLVLDDAARTAIAPGLNGILSGPVRVKLVGAEQGRHRVTADLTGARLAFPWVGWTKGAGVEANASFVLETGAQTASIGDFRLAGGNFELAGSATLAKGALATARFSRVRLNRGDDISVELKRSGSGYRIDIKGESFDVRSLAKQLLSNPERAAATAKGMPITLAARIGSVTGFDGETLSGLTLDYRGTGARIDSMKLAGQSRSGKPVSASSSTDDGRRTVQLQSADAGAILRLLDIYPHMQGGSIALNLSAQGDGPLKGQIEARNFDLVGEPRLRSIVSTPTADSPSLNQAVRRDIDTTRVTFERGSASIEKGTGFLNVDNGVLRGPLIGTTFQGSVYDRSGKMAITGTFMPAYGLNRLFAEIPLFGHILGNGRDRGLIGITYRVAGDVKAPRLEVNPISAIAPGIFRSIFEYN